MENKENIIAGCKKCFNQRREDFQKTFDKYSLKIGNFVKKGFKEKEEVEHMWVKITGLKGDRIVGILNNEPVVLKDIKLGDFVEVKFDEIENYL